MLKSIDENPPAAVIEEAPGSIVETNNETINEIISDPSNQPTDDLVAKFSEKVQSWEIKQSKPIDLFRKGKMGVYKGNCQAHYYNCH